MNIHYLQHIAFEDLANIKAWTKSKKHKISCTKLFNNENLPSVNSFDFLIIMGGPMNIYEEKKYRWLVAEKKFIEKTISAEKFVLGICLGAQLIANVLGGKVTKNKFKEIGWFKVTKTKSADKSLIFKNLPKNFTAFHWHGDTFSIPKNCLQLAESEGCKNQGFEYNKKFLALQFHLESTKESIDKLIKNCSNELVEGKYIQKKEAMLSLKNILKANNFMNLILNNIQHIFSS